MNGDDLLARATRALRDTTSPVEDAAAATTLARIEDSLAPRRSRARQRAMTRWLVMPLAASFLVFAAWASASGRLARWVSLRSHDDAERIAQPATSFSAPSKPSSGSLPAALPLPAASATVEDAPTATHVTPPPSASPPPTPKGPALSVDVDTLYREAHDAHFVRRDPAAALAAWDRYLAAAGSSGRFALEARYNRALSLVRLGRRAEAAAALRPFADGEYGGYRREEAAQLLHTLE